MAPQLQTDQYPRIQSRITWSSHRPGHRNRFVSFIRRAALVAVIGYVAFHVLRGDFAPNALLEQKRELQEAESTVAELQTRHDRLQDRVSRLSRESLDLDLLEERVRVMLGWARPGEYVFVVNPDKAGQ
ncbi:MAG: septum formation initiator family protein [Alphaproteobacteria bacterium]|nr:septum formation initiator family protein [Alphaproteobacteria bacterium]